MVPQRCTFFFYKWIGRWARVEISKIHPSTSLSLSLSLWVHLFPCIPQDESAAIFFSLLPGISIVLACSRIMRRDDEWNCGSLKGRLIVWRGTGRGRRGKCSSLWCCTSTISTTTGTTRITTIRATTIPPIAQPIISTTTTTSTIMSPIWIKRSTRGR